MILANTPDSVDASTEIVKLLMQLVSQSPTLTVVVTTGLILWLQKDNIKSLFTTVKNKIPSFTNETDVSRVCKVTSSIKTIRKASCFWEKTSRDKIADACDVIEKEVARHKKATEEDQGEEKEDNEQ